jgi:hypothetical protein
LSPKRGSAGISCDGQGVGLVVWGMGVVVLLVVVIKAVEGAWFPDAIGFLALSCGLAYMGSSIPDRVSLVADSLVVFEGMGRRVVVKAEDVTGVYKQFGRQSVWSFEDRWSISFYPTSMPALRALVRELERINPYVDIRLGHDTVD